MLVASTRPLLPNRKTLAAAGVIGLLLTGCAGTDQSTTNRTVTGAGAGAVVGGVIGSFSGNWGKGAAAGAAIGATGGYLYDQVKKDNE